MHDFSLSIRVPFLEASKNTRIWCNNSLSCCYMPDYYTNHPNHLLCLLYVLLFFACFRVVTVPFLEASKIIIYSNHSLCLTFVCLLFVCHGFVTVPFLESSKSIWCNNSLSCSYMPDYYTNYPRLMRCMCRYAEEIFLETIGLSLFSHVFSRF